MPPTLEELSDRVARLERIIDERLPTSAGRKPPKDWRNSLGKITDDEVTREIINEALRMREEERAAAADWTLFE